MDIKKQLEIKKAVYEMFSKPESKQIINESVDGYVKFENKSYKQLQNLKESTECAMADDNETEMLQHFNSFFQMWMTKMHDKHGDKVNQEFAQTCFARFNDMLAGMERELSGDMDDMSGDMSGDDMSGDDMSGDMSGDMSDPM